MNLDKGSLGWIFRHTKKYLWAVVLLAVMSGCVALGFILLALVSRRVIDIATGDASGGLIVNCGYLFGIILLQAILNILYSNVTVRVSGRIEIALKQDLFDALLQKQWRQVSAFHSGEILNRFTSDVNVVVSGVVSLIPQCVNILTKLLAGLGVLLWMDPLFAFTVLAAGGLVALASRLYSTRFKGLHKKCQETDGRTRSFLQECTENIVMIKSYLGERSVLKRLKVLQENNLRAKVRRNTYSNLANTGMFLLFNMGYFAVLAWGALRIAGGVMTFGTLTAFLQIISQIRQPFAGMSGLLPKYYSMIASAERIRELEQLENEPEGEGHVDPNGLYDKMDSLCFSDVSYSYGDGMVLDHAEFLLQKGETAAVMGKSGCGKSTFMKLLLGLIEPDGGRIYIKCRDGEEVPVGPAARGLFAYVPQGNMLFSGTLRDNIAFCRAEAADEQIMEAAEAACIGTFIRTLPDGLDTVIGERGLGLSEGQVQRIAVARAVLTGAPILLLDEATSALDEENERLILQSIQKLKDRTCIAVSHRRACLAVCDRLFRLENGRFAETKSQA